jgi:TrmH family RNA methyltransferase
MGSAFRLPHARIKDVATALRTLRESRIRAIAAVAEGGVPYAEADLRGPIALVLGSEGQGLASAVTQAADARVTIPLAAPVESLNVGVAGALLLFEAARQRR